MRLRSSASAAGGWPTPTTSAVAIPPEPMRRTAYLRPPTVFLWDDFLATGSNSASGLSEVARATSL